MKLQKLLYLCQGWHLAWDAEPLFDAEIQAWANGPVVYDVYEQHSGGFKVGPSWSAGTATDLEENETETVDAVIDMYTDWSARQLVIYTHEHRLLCRTVPEPVTPPDYIAHMSYEKSDKALRPFTVVLRGPSAIRIPPGTGARCVLEDVEIEVRIQTRWVESGFEHPLPRELYFEVRLFADSIDDAIEQARVMSSVVTSAISFAMNAEIGPIEPHIAFETTPGVEEREFVEYFIRDEDGHISHSRGADAEVIAETIKAVIGTNHPKRVMNALGHYHAALTHYFLGGESLSVGHLFMAAEALREAVLAARCASEGVSEVDLMTTLGFEHRSELLSWARKELVFGGDSETHRGAKHASDAFEHGYESIGEVRAAAEAVCDSTFGYVRSAIIGLLDLPDQIEESLLDRFGAPHDSKSMRRRITGTLIGDTEDLAMEGEPYPYVEWNSKIKTFDISDDAPPTMTFTDKFTMRISDSVSMQLKSGEIRGRLQPGATAKEVTVELSEPE